MSDELLFNKYEVFGIHYNQPLALKKRIARGVLPLLPQRHAEHLKQAAFKNDSGGCPALPVQPGSGL